MKVVQVTALGKQTTKHIGLFETPSDAIGYLRAYNPVDFMKNDIVDTVIIRWVKVGNPSYSNIIYKCRAVYNEGRIALSEWDIKDKKYITLFYIGDSLDCHNKI